MYISLLLVGLAAMPSDHVIQMASGVNYNDATSHETPYVMFLTGPPTGLP